MNYFRATNEKAYKHFVEAGATLTKRVKTYQNPEDAPEEVYEVTGLPCCASRNKFSKYMYDNGLIMYGHAPLKKGEQARKGTIINN